MNETLKTIYARRAVRKYKSIPVEKNLLEQIIEAGRIAPSAMNRQPWSFYVLTEPKDIHAFSGQISKAAVKEITRKGIKTVAKMIVELIRSPVAFMHIRESDFVFHGAPVVIFLTAPVENEWAALDIGMCCQNMMLAAKSLGLDSCPIGFGKYVEHTKLFPQLRIPADEQVLLSVIFGYGDEQPEAHERRKGNVFYIAIA